MKRIIIIGLIILLTGFIKASAADNWPVPEDFNSLVNQVEFNNLNVGAGKDIYDRNCKSCHGDPGNYNALPLVPPPPDAASEVMQSNNDGQLFYKITMGRGAMPQFETTLRPDDIWKVITYIRKFDPRNEGKLEEESLRKGKIYALVGINNSTIDIVAEEENSNDITPLNNSTVFIRAKKAFGSLLVGTITTDAYGKASFVIPSDMKVKSDGKVDFILSLSDDFEPVTFAVSGVQVKQPDQYVEPPRVLWSTNDRTQVWLLFTYFTALIGGWTVIGYVILQILKLYRLGRNNKQ
jgi:mono/diheme cytochrome c family protein